ncbi:MAG: VWA domain-containing protein [Desulforegulaceae bacterium]|nr:VWA domain-containing protein [Desulforegulaceae bacterium]
MLETILKFTACCRASNFYISTAQTLDCVEHLKLIDPTDEASFKTVLKTNFVKTQRDNPRFEALYNLYFHDMGIELETEINQDQDIRNKVLEELKNFALETNDPIFDVLMEFLSGDPHDYLGEITDIHTRVEKHQAALKSNMGQLALRLDVMLKINKLRSRVLELVKNFGGNAQSETRESVEQHFAKMLDKAYEILTKEPRPDNVGLKDIKNTDKKYKNIGEKAFSNLTPDEIELTREVIDQLVKKLKDIASRRFMSRNKGVLDIKKTLKDANKFQGVPVNIHYKNKPLRKGKIVTLCDISGSVWSAARFMLNILFSLQDCFSRVKSYVFVSGVCDVTDIFDKYQINDAIDKIMSEADIEYDVPTDYGETFIDFKTNHMHELNSKTTLIIIGDARSNYMNPHSEILEEMRAKCKRIIWLNPEPLNTWDTGDSEMYAYKAHVNEVRPCQNLNQLFDFIEDLIL